MAVVSAEKERSYSSDYMAEGKFAEDVVMALLSKQPWIAGLSDLRGIKAMQDADLDISILLADGRVRFAEIKSDKYFGVSGNVLFEVLRINHTAPPEKVCTLGWTARTPATWIFYYAPKVEKVYQCTASELRRALQRYSQEVRHMTRLDWVSTDNLKSTINILIPWSYCKDFFKVWDVAPIATVLRGRQGACGG